MNLRISDLGFLENEAYIERVVKIGYMVSVGKEWISGVAYPDRPEMEKTISITQPFYEFTCREQAEAHADRVGGTVYERVTIKDSFMRPCDGLDFNEEAQNLHVYDGLSED